jgi:hypothetical protein
MAGFFIQYPASSIQYPTSGNRHLSLLRCACAGRLLRTGGTGARNDAIL